MSLELWLMNIFSCFAIVAGGWAMINYVFPMIEDVLSSAIKDKKALNGIMGLLNIVILWIVVQGIIIYILRIKSPYLEFLDIFTPGLDVFLEFLPHLKWVLLGWFIIYAIKKR